ncbi:Xaa-Pro aminopeptidase [Alteribacillus persepolensis]|uniref:Xaa-Pro aminopeptidase n=1 Tax=Alteribacillus persepolensis TaxID=568899 RepID=A0A1G8CYV1_9BACI|nr:Xaa-Pro peptidase family protein [Alteribacillus persepolensis]SDH50698.1 Xaa-Pro aminopeptidase [Alteribacillus persepolensis]
MTSRLEQLRTVLKKNDVEAIFIQSAANRRYLSGFTGTAGSLLVTGANAYFITDFRYIQQAKEQCPDYEIVEQTSTAYKNLAELIKKHDIASLAFEKEHVSYASFEALQHYCQGINLKPTDGIVEEIRMTKDDNELAVLQEAADVADSAFSHITHFIKPGMKETEVRDELEFFMRKQGADASSFDIIVASGYRSALPHGVASEKVIEKGELVTLDFGAYYKGYCSDITRTVAVGSPSEELKAIYNTVYEAQLKAVSEIKAGMTGKEADTVAREYIKENGYGGYFGHGLGHGLGMEVHEGPRLSPKGERTLEPGMVVTVEPGIYVPELGGTRIEDDIVITKDGNKRLTKSPKELMVIGE